MVKRDTRADHGFIVERPGKTQRRIKIVEVSRNLSKFYPSRPQIGRSVKIMVDIICLERPCQAVVKCEFRTDLPAILKVEAEMVIGRQLVVEVLDRLTRISNPN